MDDPLTKRLKLLARDSQNVAMSVLTIFTGTRSITKKRDKFSGEIHKLIEQVTATTESWHELEQMLFYLEAKTSEVSEGELIRIVEGAADSAMLAEHMGEVYRLKYIDCAIRLANLDRDLLPEMVKEVQTHEGGIEQLSALFVAIEELMKENPK